ncbi:hypothetical protein GZOEXZXM_CDS0225 [Salmonella phage SeKF_64]
MERLLTAISDNGRWESASGIEPETVRTMKSYCISPCISSGFLNFLNPRLL